MLRRFAKTFSLVGSCALIIPGFAQSPDTAATGDTRVTVSMNADGSRTVYEFDPANHKAVATTTAANGKVLGKINYTLDPAGRFSTGEVHGRDGALRFKTAYQYDANGRIQQETQLDKNDAVQHKLVYSYDANGKQTGYAVYDASGNLVSRSGAGAPGGTGPEKSRPRKTAGTR